MVLAALIISIIALVVALLAVPTFLQMIYGRPKIKIVFDHYGINDDWMVIRCKLFNLVIVNRFLKAIGVNRVTAEDVIARYRIVEQANKSVIVDKIPYFRTGRGGRLAQRVSLAASEYPALFSVLGLSKAGEFAYYIQEKPQKISISPGVYQLSVTVEVGDKDYNRSTFFKVLESKPYWVLPI